MRKINIYGFGGLGQKLLHFCIANNIDVINILDMGKIGKAYDKFIVQDPANCENKDIDVVITILNEYADLDEIKTHLYELGFNNVFNIFEAVRDIPELTCFEHLFITNTNKFIGHDIDNKINAVRSMLSDKESIDTFDALVEFRKSFKYESINSLFDKNMYAPAFLQHHFKDRKCNIIDCGACYGDLIDILKSKNIDISSYYGFEPDPDNLVKLRDKLVSSNIDGVILPMGVGDFSGNIGFDSGAGTGSSINELSDNKIYITKIDDVIYNKVDFVKMDIEGFEQKALNGMSRIIDSQKPVLAISIYHKPFDFIDIPLSLSLSLSLSYTKYYIRNHRNFGLDIVFYAKV